MTAPLKLALFGDPVEHSLSPEIHRRFGRQLGLPLEYRRIRTDNAGLSACVAQFRADGGTGANLTVPLKQNGRRLCSRLDPAARQARAVNTLKLHDGDWHGYNTDGPGLLLDLERLGRQITGQRVLVVGAGGAAAGLIAPLLAAQPVLVCILNRTLTRAQELAERFEHLGPVVANHLDRGPGASDFSLVIQATSLGHQGAAPTLRGDWLAPDAVVYDLNYGAAHTPVARWCEQQGLSCHDGLGMLVAQAALAFEIWTGQRPEITSVMEELAG